MSDDAVRYSKKLKAKGDKCEAACRNAIRDLGFPACRTTPLSGQFSYLGIPDLIGDIKAGFKLGEHGREVTVQCKSRKNGAGFASLYGWLADGITDLLWLKRDRHPALCVMTADTFKFFLSLVPPDLRLPGDTDRLRGLRQAASMNPYALAALRKIESFQGDEVAAEANPLASIEIPAPEEKPPF